MKIYFFGLTDVSSVVSSFLGVTASPLMSPFKELFSTAMELSEIDFVILQEFAPQISYLNSKDASCKGGDHYRICKTPGPLIICDVVLTVVAVRRKEKVHLQSIVQLVQTVNSKQTSKFSFNNGENGAKIFIGFSETANSQPSRDKGKYCSGSTGT